MRENDRTIARAVATGALLVGAGTLFVVQQNYTTSTSGGRDIGAAWPIGAVLVALGVLGWLRVSFVTYLLAAIAALTVVRFVFGAFTTPFPFSLAIQIHIVAAGLIAPAAWLLPQSGGARMATDETYLAGRLLRKLTGRRWKCPLRTVSA